MKYNQSSETTTRSSEAEIMLARPRRELKEQSGLREHLAEGAVPGSSPSLGVSHL